MTPPSPSASPSNPSVSSCKFTSRLYSWHPPDFLPDPGPSLHLVSPVLLTQVLSWSSHLHPNPLPTTLQPPTRLHNVNQVHSLTTPLWPPHLSSTMPPPNCSPHHPTSPTSQCSRLWGSNRDWVPFSQVSILVRGTEDIGWGNNKCQGEGYDKASREGGADFCGRSGDPSKKRSFQQRLTEVRERALWRYK